MAEVSEDGLQAADERKKRFHTKFYREIAKLRKLAANKNTESAKYYELSEKYRAKASKCIEKAVGYRRKIPKLNEKCMGIENVIKEFETSLSLRSEKMPEKIRTKIADHRRKLAKYKKEIEYVELKAAKLNEKGALYKIKAEEFLDDSKICKAIAEGLSKTADELERSKL